MSEDPKHCRVLIIDDTPSIHDDFRKILASGIEEPRSTLDDLASSIFGEAPAPAASADVVLMDSAFDGMQGLSKVEIALAEGRPYSLAFVDMRMPPGWDGLETISRLWKVDPDLQIVICSAYSDHSWASIRKKLGESDNLLILKKPFDHSEVLQLTHTLIRKWLISRRLSAHIHHLDELVTQRTRALRQAEERFVHAFDASPLAQAILDLATGEILGINSAFETLCGQARAEVAGKPVLSLGIGIDPQKWTDLLDRLRHGGNVDEYAFVLRRENEPPREMRCSARAVTIDSRPCSVWVIRDVTEQLRIEQQLRQSQRMDAIGQLSAGIAHDFNNLLTAILNFTSFGIEDSSGIPNVRHHFSQIKGAAERAAALTRQLLVVSRQQVTDVRPIDFRDVVTGLSEMLRRLIPERIDLAWDLPPGLPWVLADRANIEQIVLNLVVNARDALPRTGKIELELKQSQFGVGDLSGHADRTIGTFVRFSVCDDGVGIPPEILHRIFEPFFTTKGPGEGTGLGLATVYSVCKQHRGWVEVFARPKGGTRFDVYFPAHARPSPRTVPPFPVAAQPAQSALRILYTEDDPVVQKVTHTLLSRHFPNVVVASDGPCALKLWEEHQGAFDLLITDMVMPNGMSGYDLARALRSQAPHLKVVFTSGYSAQLIADDEGSTHRHVLQKPYTHEGLMRIVREALADEGADAPASSVSSIRI